MARIPKEELARSAIAIVELALGGTGEPYSELFTETVVEISNRSRSAKELGYNMASLVGFMGQIGALALRDAERTGGIDPHEWLQAQAVFVSVSGKR